MIIGRKSELKTLDKAFKSKEAEFITIYGRRRVGKTYLIRTFFSEKKCTFFHVTGIQEGSLRVQLHAFSEALTLAFHLELPLPAPKNWHEAFGYLHKLVLQAKGEKVVIFLDELPWMATRRSGLMQAMAYYWNQYWFLMPNVVLIVCGSSASWLIRKVIYNKGGLHNRTTIEMRLSPFNLLETRDYLKSRKVTLNNKQILSLYMAFGGIPYYLRSIDPGLTAQQNIQKLLFSENGTLRDEFSKLFDSLFDSADAYKELIAIISQKREGMERAELQVKATLSTGGGTLTKRLNDLKETGFIKEFTPWSKIRGEYFMVIDEYCLFYLHWVAPHKHKDQLKNFWLNVSQRPAYYAWSGYAFEAVCMKHSEQIIKALDLPTAITFGPWRYVPTKSDEDGAQIDLVIDRTDGATTLCEIKYTEQPFVLDKQYAKVLQQKASLFQKEAKSDKQIFLAMISASGVKPGMYSEEMLSGVATLEDLFKQE